MWLFFSSFARQRNVNWLYVTRYIGGWGNIGNLSHSPPRVPSTLHGDLMGGKPGLNVLEQQQRQSTFKLGHHFSKVAKSLWLRFSDTKRHNHLRHFSKSTTASCRNRPCRYIQLMATVQSSSALCPTSPRNCVFGNELGYREVCSTLASWWSGISWIKLYNDADEDGGSGTIISTQRKAERMMQNLPRKLQTVGQSVVDSSRSPFFHAFLGIVEVAIFGGSDNLPSRVEKGFLAVCNRHIQSKEQILNIIKALAR